MCDVTLNFHTFEKGKCVNKEESPYKPDPVHRFREWITIHLVTQLLT